MDLCLFLDQSTSNDLSFLSVDEQSLGDVAVARGARLCAGGGRRLLEAPLVLLVRGHADGLDGVAGGVVEVSGDAHAFLGDGELALSFDVSPELVDLLALEPGALVLPHHGIRARRGAFVR